MSIGTSNIYPQLMYISGVTNAQQAVVTFTADHEFTLGENVGFRVTKDFGMRELNQKIGKVIAVTSDTITVNVDTTGYTPFTYALINTAGTTPPCCVPSSSSIIDGEYIPTVILSDAFDNLPS